MKRMSHADGIVYPASKRRKWPKKVKSCGKCWRIFSADHILAHWKNCVPVTQALRGKSLPEWMLDHIGEPMPMVCFGPRYKVTKPRAPVHDQDTNEASATLLSLGTAEDNEDWDVAWANAIGGSADAPPAKGIKRILRMLKNSI